MTDTQYLYQYFLEQSRNDKENCLKPKRTVKKAAAHKTADKKRKSEDMNNG